MMFAFLAPAALKLVAGRMLSHAAHDVSAVGGWLGRQKPVTLLCMALGVALLVQHIVDHRHAAKLSSQLTKSAKALTDTRAAFAQTVASYRAAAAKAATDDKANADRVRAEQSKNNQERSNAFEARLTAARATADRMRHDPQASTYRGGGGTTPVPGIRAPAAGSAQSAGQGGLSRSDAEKLADRICGPDGYHDWDANGPVCEKENWTLDDRLIATEQAIQLDELIKWVRRQAGIDVNGPPPKP